MCDMTILPSCITRYCQNGIAQPSDIGTYIIGERVRDELDCTKIAMAALCSTSALISALIGYAHESLMGSTYNCAFKFTGVVFLELANIANTALAVVEGMIRTALAIIPAALDYFNCLDLEEHEILGGLVIGTLITLLTIPGGFVQAYDMATSTSHQKHALVKLYDYFKSK